MPADGGTQVEDVRPTAEGDPRGAAINLIFLPLIVICLPLVALLGRLGLPPRELLGMLVAFAAASGLLIAALAGALDALPGPYLAVAGVTALIVLAVALPAAGLMRPLGPPGIGVAALLFIVIGNPGSGNASAPELLPGFWRVTGQLLPPGAGGQALRGAPTSTATRSPPRCSCSAPGSPPAPCWCSWPAAGAGPMQRRPASRARSRWRWRPDRGPAPRRRREPRVPRARTGRRRRGDPVVADRLGLLRIHRWCCSSPAAP